MSERKKKLKIEKEEEEVVTTEQKDEIVEGEEQEEEEFEYYFDKWEELLTDLQLYILSFLDIEDLVTFGFCSKKSLKLSREPRLWERTLDSTILNSLTPEILKSIKGLIFPRGIKDEDFIGAITSCPSIQEIRFSGFSKLTLKSIDGIISNCKSLKRLEYDFSLENGIEKLKKYRPEIEIFEEEDESYDATDDDDFEEDEELEEEEGYESEDDFI